MGTGILTGTQILTDMNRQDANFRNPSAASNECRLTEDYRNDSGVASKYNPLSVLADIFGQKVRQLMNLLLALIFFRNYIQKPADKQAPYI